MKRFLFALAWFALASEPLAAQDVNGDSNPPAATTVDPVAQQTAQANANTALYNSQAAAANAKLAATTAKVAADKAAFGSFVGMSSTGGGTVTPNTGASQAEATLLATLATRRAATNLATKISSRVEGREVILLTDVSQLSAADAMQFDLQLNLARAALTAAKVTCGSAISDSKKGVIAAKSRGGFIDDLTPVGAAFDAGSKLLSYFQTDYGFSGVQVTEPSNLTAAAVAEALLNLQTISSVIIPSNLLASNATSVIDQINPVETTYVEVAGMDAQLKSLATAFRTKDAALAAELDQADAQAAKAMTVYEAFVNGLLTAPPAGVEAPIVRIVRGKMIQQHVNGPSGHSLVLFVVDQTVGENFTKKNLWTFFGGPPLYTMGGVSSAYILYDPREGGILAAGAIPVHGGYKSVNAVQDLIK